MAEPTDEELLAEMAEALDMSQEPEPAPTPEPVVASTTTTSSRPPRPTSVSAGTSKGSTRTASRPAPARRETLPASPASIPKEAAVADNPSSFLALAKQRKQQEAATQANQAEPGPDDVKNAGVFLYEWLSDDVMSDPSLKPLMVDAIKEKPDFGRMLAALARLNPDVASEVQNLAGGSAPAVSVPVPSTQTFRPAPSAPTTPVATPPATPAATTPAAQLPGSAVGVASWTRSTPTGNKPISYTAYPKSTDSDPDAIEVVGRYQEGGEYFETFPVSGSDWTAASGTLTMLLSQKFPPPAAPDAAPASPPPAGGGIKKKAGALLKAAMGGS